ncbi:MAG: hypothetical protein WB768_00960, partial [Bradyrhizobium sp.]
PHLSLRLRRRRFSFQSKELRLLVIIDVQLICGDICFANKTMVGLERRLLCQFSFSPKKLAENSPHFHLAKAGRAAFTAPHS